jgi:hypothetical protein
MTVFERNLRLAVALSVLDSTVKYEDQSDISVMGKRWSREILKHRAKVASQQFSRDEDRNADDILKILESLLSAERPEGQEHPISLLFDRSQTPPSLSTDSLHEFLQAALDQAISIGIPQSDLEGMSAGCIYFYDWLHDELVMAASQGFPFMCTLAREKSGCKIKWKGMDPSKHSAPELKKVRKHLGHLKDLSFQRGDPKHIRALKLNLSRLLYARKVLQKRVGSFPVRRDGWIKEELSGVYDILLLEELRKGEVSLDCNEDLIGIAYYRPGERITGQLFDVDEGPKLERTRFREADEDGKDSFTDTFTKELEKFLAPGPFLRHLEEEVRDKRTVVFNHRSNMAAGRQVVAGAYEGLQFPLSNFIGPFLGTVLRFNGEHLGILKVEKHAFCVEHVSEALKDERYSGLPKFRGTETARFLAFAYALAGLLHVLKNYAGLDLNRGWMKAAHGLPDDRGTNAQSEGCVAGEGPRAVPGA